MFTSSCKAKMEGQTMLDKALAPAGIYEAWVWEWVEWLGELDKLP